MKFCPKCQARLKIDSSDSEFVCPKCGYSEKGNKITKEVKNETAQNDEHVAMDAKRPDQAWDRRRHGRRPHCFIVDDSFDGWRFNSHGAPQNYSARWKSSKSGRA